MPVDHFPSTHATWIDAQLTIAERSRAAGDAVGEINAIDALRRHLMERYHAALPSTATTLANCSPVGFRARPNHGSVATLQGMLFHAFQPT